MNSGMNTGMNTELTAADLDELRNLCLAYAEAADDKRFDDMGALFAEDGALVSPRGTTEGRARITKAFGGLARFDATFHLLGQIRHWVDTPEAESTGTRVRGVAYCTAHHFTEAGDHVMYIRYHDTYIEEDGAWRFAERRLEVPGETDH